MANPSPTELARYRPFRIAMWTIYLTCITAFSLMIIISVVRSVMQMTPRSPPASETRSVPECVQQAQQAFLQLDTQRKDLSQARTALHANVTWTEFRIHWLYDVRAHEAACGLDEPDRKELKSLYRELEHVEDLYTTAAVQYSGEIGPSVDKLRQSLAEMLAK